MIRWYDKMYMDETVMLDPEKYKNIVTDYKIHIPPVYCIILSSDGNNLLEIIRCNEFIFNYYKKKDMFIVGLSSSYKNAVKLVTSIIMEVYEKTGAFDIHGYLTGEPDRIG